jgi:hypothetical protein
VLSWRGIAAAAVLGWRERERVGEEPGDKGTRERVEGGRRRERESGRQRALLAVAFGEE